MAIGNTDGLNLIAINEGGSGDGNIHHLNSSLGQVNLQQRGSPSHPQAIVHPVCEDEDIFCCGKCKQQFNNLQVK